MPLHHVTKVTIEAVGRFIHLYLNQTRDSIIELSSGRIYGDAYLYVSDPWSIPAIATISPVKMEALSEFTKSPVHTATSPISRLLTYTKTTVPENYNLSFEITPTRVSSDRANILHFSKDGSDAGPGSRIPGNHSSAHSINQS